MKKNYTMPRTATTRLTATQFIAVSISNNSDDGPGLPSGNLNEEGGDGNQLVREDIWSDNNEW